MESQILMHLADALAGLSLPGFLAALFAIGFVLYALIVGLVVIINNVMDTDADNNR